MIASLPPRRPWMGVVLLVVAGCASTRTPIDDTGIEPGPVPAYTVEGDRVEPDGPAEERARSPRLTVGEAVLEALETNRTVQLARIGVALGRTGEREALSAMIPQLGWRGSFSRRDTPATIPFQGGSIAVGPKDVLNSDFTITWPVFAFGRFFHAYRAAQLARGSAEADRDTAESDIAAAVVAACYDLLETVQQIEVARSDEEALAQQVKDSQALLDAGRVTRSALLEAEVEFERARRSRERLESLVPIRRMIVNQLLGRPVHAALEIVDDPVTRPPAGDLERFEQEAITLRPEMRSIRLELEGARRTERSVLGGELGQVTARAVYHTDDNDFSSPNDLGTIELGLEIPIFTGGGRTARIRRARHETALVRVRMAELEEGIRTEVHTAWNEAVQLYADIEVAQRSIERAEESLRIQREKFNSGRATSREVLDSTTLLTSARFSYVRSLYSYNIALQELHRARGGDPEQSPLPGLVAPETAVVPAEATEEAE